MRKRLWLATLLAFASAPALVHAKASTTKPPEVIDVNVDRFPPGYRGADFDAVFRSKQSKPKGEYETSAAYLERLKGLSGGLYAFGFTPEEVKYDADKQALIVVLRSDQAYTGGSLYSYDFDRSSLVVRESDKVTGSYTGQTGLGVRVKVRKDTQTDRSLVVGIATSRFFNLTSITLPMLPESALALRPSLSYFYVCQLAPGEVGPARNVTVSIPPEYPYNNDRTLLFRYLYVDKVSVWTVNSKTGEVISKTDLIEAPNEPALKTTK